MNTLAWWLLQNTLTLTLLVPLVALACRLFRQRPAVCHRCDLQFHAASGRWFLASRHSGRCRPRSGEPCLTRPSQRRTTGEMQRMQRTSLF